MGKATYFRDRAGRAIIVLRDEEGRPTAIQRLPNQRTGGAPKWLKELPSRLRHLPERKRKR